MPKGFLKCCGGIKLKGIKMEEFKLEDIFEKISEIFSENTNKKYVRLPIQRNQELLKNFFENIILNDGFVCGGFGRVSVSKNKDLIPSGDIDIYTKGKEQFEAISKRLEQAGYYAWATPRGPPVGTC